MDQNKNGMADPIKHGVPPERKVGKRKWRRNLGPIQRVNHLAASIDAIEGVEAAAPAPPPPPPPPPPAPPLVLPPPAPKRPPLPGSLQHLGNAQAWQAVLSHVLGPQRHRALVVAGPTGCGKSKGVLALLAAAGFTNVLQLDGSDAETVPELLLWVKRTRQTHGVLHGASAVFLDDFESFSSPARKALGKLLTAEDKTLCPLVITCAQPRDPEYRELRPLVTIRLNAPSPRVVEDWFTRLYPAHLVAQVREFCETRDLRRVHNAIWFLQRAHGTSKLEHVRPITSTFDATRRLLTRRCSAAEWAQHVEPRDVDFLRHHLAPHVGDLDALAAAAEGLSFADACRPARGEHHEHAPVRYLAGMTARFYARAEDIGAMPPPPRPERPQEPPRAEGGRPPTRAEWREVPAALRPAA